MTIGMPGFTFRLGSLLKLRERARDERRSQLAEAHRAEEMLERQGAEIDGELAALRGAYGHAAAPGRLEVDRLIEAQRYELVLRARRQLIEKQGKLLAAEVERRRQALVEADRDVRILEKLHEKQRLRHQDQHARRQAREFDEVAARTKHEEHQEWLG